ncbi:hypothetical protein C7999DRAFT_14992 [Corynascus novoguineensis]|uniref:Uncharacterized protein n=1 Tax=Corynascus novoguineensis TaxID=1126955 RepID=A0AAN7CTB7_9PEZI|nr:hypothetical protein C7999DRAFT_14992 [Corynascus novoguineensis]
MGLLLRHSNSFTHCSEGPSPSRLSNQASDLDQDRDLWEPSPDRHRPIRYNHSSQSRSKSTRISDRKTISSEQHLNDRYTCAAHRHEIRLNRLCGPRYNRNRNHQTHHVKPRGSFAADAEEGRALARSSSVVLPGEPLATISSPSSKWRRTNSRRSRSCESSISFVPQGQEEGVNNRRRPPSLERQDAFRDERTAKRRRAESGCRLQKEEDYNGDEFERERECEHERAQVAELYRIGLLYDDEHERGEGFSLDRIIRDEPAYSLRVRPTPGRTQRHWAGRDRPAGGDYVSLSAAVDLAFSAFGEDETLARWMLSGSSSSSSLSGSMDSDLDRAAGEEEARPWREAMRDTPRLTVLYELADDAVSAVSAGDSLDDISVSELSFVGNGELGDDELVWAMLDGNDGKTAPEAVNAVVGEDEGVDPWVVLGHDGS